MSAVRVGRLLAAAIVAAFVLGGGVSHATASAPVFVDQALFTSTVPALMTLGDGYQVQVDVVNNGAGTVKGAVQLVYPEEYFFSVQPTQFVDLAPGENTLLRFDLVAANPHVGPMNISALLFVNGTGGFALADTASTTVYSIQRSQFASNLPYLLALVIAAAGASVVVLSKRRKNPRGLGGAEGRRWISCMNAGFIFVLSAIIPLKYSQRATVRNRE